MLAPVKREYRHVCGVFELAGICKRWRKPPYYSLADEEMEMLNEELIKLGIM